MTNDVAIEKTIACEIQVYCFWKLKLQTLEKKITTTITNTNI